MYASAIYSNKYFDSIHQFSLGSHIYELLSYNTVCSGRWYQHFGELCCFHIDGIFQKIEATWYSGTLL